MALLSGLLNIEIELERKISEKDEIGTPEVRWEFWKRRKCTHSNPPPVSTNFSSDQNRYVSINDTFTMRYDEEINYEMRLKYNNAYYKIQTISIIERKKHMVLTCLKIENNQYGDN